MEPSLENEIERNANRPTLVDKVFGEIWEVTRAGLYLVPWFGDKKIISDSSNRTISTAIITFKYDLIVNIPTFIFYKAQQVYQSLGSELGDSFNLAQETASNAMHLVQ